MTELRTIAQTMPDGSEVLYRATGTPDIEQGDVIEPWYSPDWQFAIVIVTNEAGERSRYLFQREDDHA